MREFRCLHTSQKVVSDCGKLATEMSIEFTNNEFNFKSFIETVKNYLQPQMPFHLVNMIFEQKTEKDKFLVFQISTRPNENRESISMNLVFQCSLNQIESFDKWITLKETFSHIFEEYDNTEDSGAIEDIESSYGHLLQEREALMEDIIPKLCFISPFGITNEIIDNRITAENINPLYENLEDSKKGYIATNCNLLLKHIYKNYQNLLSNHQPLNIEINLLEEMINEVLQGRDISIKKTGF